MMESDVGRVRLDWNDFVMHTILLFNRSCKEIPAETGPYSENTANVVWCSGLPDPISVEGQRVDEGMPGPRSNNSAGIGGEGCSSSRELLF